MNLFTTKDFGIFIVLWDWLFELKLIGEFKILQSGAVVIVLGLTKCLFTWTGVGGGLIFKLYYFYIFF